MGHKRHLILKIYIFHIYMVWGRIFYRKFAIYNNNLKKKVSIP